jgi:hypothetical protein
MIRCTKCDSANVRIQVDLCLNIPARLLHRLSKQNLRSKDVRIEGANWPKMTMLCEDCGWFCWGQEKKMVTHWRNWKCPTQTVCRLAIHGRRHTRELGKLDCSVCSLRILREGQAMGLRAEDILDWDVELLESGNANDSLPA